MRFSQEEMEAALKQINQNQKPLMGFIGSLVGAFVGLVLYVFFSQMGGALYLMLALPPASVGVFARFTGRTYKAKHRIAVGFVGAIVHIIGCILLALNPLIFLLTPVAFGISMQLAKIKLERVHIWAIKQAELGKLNIED